MPIDAIRLPSIEQIPYDLNSVPGPWITLSSLPWEWMWFTGVAFFAGIQLFRVVRFHKMLRLTSEPFVSSLQSEQSLLAQFNVRPSQVFTTTVEGAPFVLGLFQPRVFFPADHQERFSAQEQRWIMLHELTHIRRGDIWLRLVSEAFRAFFWFNPLVHMASRALRQDQEYACDQAVVSRCTRQERFQYGKALMLSMGQKKVSAIPAFFGNNRDRFAMLGKHQESRWNTIAGFAVCALIGGCALTSAPTSMAQQAEPVNSPESDQVVLSDGTIPASPEGGRVVRINGEVADLPDGGGVVLVNGEAQRLPEGGGILLINGEVRSLPEEGGVILISGSEPRRVDAGGLHFFSLE